ncbi:hypothetical protein J3459_006289 [Metarhizium acridum]|nr:hypothetical protein J3459_006289 [Metarhizium acridum]
MVQHAAWGGRHTDSVFSGISAFGRLPYEPCLENRDAKYDIAFIGMALAVDFSSRRLNLYGAYNVPLEINPFNSWATVVDCGDIPVTSYDNTWALKQIEEGRLRSYPDLPLQTLIREARQLRGRLCPGHLDTWEPKVFGGCPSEVASINHGTYFYHASQQGLLANDSKIHAGIRTTLSGPSDCDNDGYCGFEIVEAREIDPIGTEGIIKRIVDRIGTERPVYLSIDIDTLDPAFAPATGTPETEGWSTRERKTILRGLKKQRALLKWRYVVNMLRGGSDIVTNKHRTQPAYDTSAEHTTMAAADVLHEVVSIMVKKGPLSKMMIPGESCEL